MTMEIIKRFVEIPDEGMEAWEVTQAAIDATDFKQSPISTWTYNPPFDRDRERTMIRPGDIFYVSVGLSNRQYQIVALRREDGDGADCSFRWKPAQDEVPATPKPIKVMP